MMSPHNKPERTRKQRKRPLDWRYKRHRDEDARGLPKEDYSQILGYGKKRGEEEEAEG